MVVLILLLKKTNDLLGDWGHNPQQAMQGVFTILVGTSCRACWESLVIFCGKFFNADIALSEVM